MLCKSNAVRHATTRARKTESRFEAIIAHGRTAFWPAPPRAAASGKANAGERKPARRSAGPRAGGSRLGESCGRAYGP